MEGQITYSVELIHGHRITRRGLAFLICESDKNINAKTVFGGLKDNKERMLRTRFDYWLDGGINDDWFHGWPNDPSYKECFVFKWNDRRLHHRLYGLLCNPLDRYTWFQLCVLVSHAKKNTWKTDPAELDAVIKLREKTEVKEAVKRAVKDLIPSPLKG
jgi:hypothetical protein